MLMVKDKVKVNNKSLKEEFINSMKDEYFRKLRNTINLSDDVLCKYTSLLNDSKTEFVNCIDCKELNNCKNSCPGFRYSPKVINDSLSFEYKKCKYKEKYDNDNNYKRNIDLFLVPSSLKNASFKEIYTDDKNRTDLIKYISHFKKSYFNNNKDKGLYLYGNFGSGKTYIIASLLNELAKENVKSAIVYFPEYLRELKTSFNKDDNDLSFKEKYDYIKKAPVLLIDDIGAENLTAWARDEILGTLLQYRMEENLSTFFTSNLSLDELEQHLSLTGQKIEKVKARRIIERIKYLTNELKLLGVDRRKQN